LSFIKYDPESDNSIVNFFEKHEDEIVTFINDKIDIPILNERQEGFLILYIFRILILVIKQFT